MLLSFFVAKAQLKTMTFAEMQIAQKQEKRKVLIDIYADWCIWCEKMDENVFAQKEVTAYLNQNFYFIRFNPEEEEKIAFKGQNYTLKSYKNYYSKKTKEYNELAVELMKENIAFPSIIFLDENLNKITYFDGYKNIAEMEAVLRFFAENKYLKMKWSEYISTFEAQWKAK